MREVMTKNMARNIFYGGSLFFIIIFLGLTVHSHLYIVNASTDKAALTDGVVRGKRIWERHACVNCHTILGEGAYYAPEVGNVMASSPWVTHCYERPTFPDWQYTHFTMIHATSQEKCEEVAREISGATNIDDYMLLYSTREYKKTRVRYFV